MHYIGHGFGCEKGVKGMKKSTSETGKKVLASALSAAMVVTFAPAVALADEFDNASVPGVSEPLSAFVAETTVGGVSKGFETFAAAVEAADEGAVVKLLSDSSETLSMISVTKTVTVDLCGYTLGSSQVKNTFLLVAQGGVLVIEDSSEAGTGKVTYDKSAAVFVKGGGSFKFKSGTIEGGGSSYSVSVSANANAEVLGGTISHKGSASTKALYCKGTVKMLSGVIESSGKAATVGSGGSLTVAGGSVSGSIYLDYGSYASSLVVGAEEGTLPFIDKIEMYTSGKKPLPIVVLNKGVIRDITASGARAKEVKLSCRASSADTLRFVNRPDDGLLSQGTQFAETVIDNEKCFYIAGLAAEDSAACVLHQGSESYYASLSAAASNLSSGDTLRLLKDCASPLSVSATDITIDLNGKTINSGSGKTCLAIAQSGNADNVVRIENGVLKSEGGAPCIEARGNTASAVTLKLANLQLSSADPSAPLLELGVGARVKDTSVNAAYVMNGGFAVGGFLYGYPATAVKHADGQDIKLVNDYVGGLQLFDSNTGVSKAVFDLNGKTYAYEISADPSWGVLDCVKDNCSVTVKNGSIDAGKAPVLLVFGNGSSFVFNNMRLSSDNSQGIAVNGSTQTSSASVQLMNSSLSMTKQEGNVGIYFPARNGSLVIDNSSVVAHTGVQVCSGSLTVVGDKTSIIATGSPVTKTENDGPVFDGAAVSVINRSGYGPLVAVSLQDGAFTARAENAAIHAFDFSGTAESEFDNSSKTVQITGGTFSADPSAYLASGYVVSDSVPYAVSKYVAPAPANPIPSPAPTPVPGPVAPGTDVSGTDSAGNTVDVTVTNNGAVTLPDGTKADGSVEYKGTTSSDGANKPATEVSVPSTVTASDGSTYVITKIADEAFEGQEQLVKVAIPETVVEIGERAFANTSLENVVIPAATTVLGTGVFQGCGDLKFVDISKAAIMEIPADAFNGAAISSIEIPTAVTNVGARAFKGTAITSVELPEAVKTIERSTFEGCAQLESIRTSAAVIGYKALSGCTALRGVDFSKATEIGKYAFKGDSGLRTVSTGAKLKTLGYKALAGTKVKVLSIKSKKLTEKSVKGSLKDSSVKKIEVAISGNKKTVSKYVAKYKKIFKKSNSGRSVEVVAKKTK